MDFFPIAPGDEQGEQIEIPDNLPILPLRNMVIFPNIMLPISVGREKSLNLIRKAFRGNKLVGAVAQRDVNVDEPSPADLYQNGTVIQIIRIFEMPDDSTTRRPSSCRARNSSESTSSLPRNHILRPTSIWLRTFCHSPNKWLNLRPL